MRPIDQVDNLFPVMLKLGGRRCLVIGGGHVAARKVLDLKAAGAYVVLAATEVSDEARQSQPAEIIEQAYDCRLLDGAMLVVAATDDAAVNSRVLADCRQRGIWCNIVDVPQMCDFIVPAVLRRGRLTVAVSTGGASPPAAALLRDQLASSLAEGAELWLDSLAAVRQRLLATVTDAGLRRKVLLRLAEADVLAAAGEGAAALDGKINLLLHEHGLPEVAR